MKTWLPWVPSLNLSGTGWVHWWLHGKECRSLEAELAGQREKTLQRSKNWYTKGSEPPKAHGSSEPSARHLSQIGQFPLQALVVEKTMLFTPRRFRILVWNFVNWDWLRAYVVMQGRLRAPPAQMKRMVKRLMMSWYVLIIYVVIICYTSNSGVLSC